MKRCIDCDYFGVCEKSGEVCEKYKKTFCREYIKMEEREDEN